MKSRITIHSTHDQYRVGMRILIIGGGGREHAIAWSLKRSTTKTDLFIAPGNGGTGELGSNVDLNPGDQQSIVGFVVDQRIDLVIIGPEQPLVDGLSDTLREHEIPVVGPSAAAARLEGSKAFSKDFMKRHSIPTAAYRTFGSHELSDALDFVNEEGAPIVVKASGLAAGKGAIVCETVAQAEEALISIMRDASLGSAGSTVVVESFMDGEEVSLFVLTDGESYALLAPAQDHKRIGEGDLGPNTGGMGAYAPAPVLTEDLMDEAVRTIIEPTLTGMSSDGCPYQGILYVGIMITGEGPKVVEYNCRFGDPETQVILPLMESDPVDVFMALARGQFQDYTLDMHPGAAVCVVMASKGYPGSYKTGNRISGVDSIDERQTVIFHAGTRRTPGGDLETTGGRVLGVSAVGENLKEALESAYGSVAKIEFEGAQFRRDIGHRGLKQQT